MALSSLIYDTEELLGVFRQMEPPTEYWLRLGFGSVHQSNDEWVDFSKISEERIMAPFAMPLAQGKPIYSEAASVSRFKPAYVKAKDPVTAARAIKRRPEEVLSKAPNDPMARYDAIVGDIVSAHDGAVRRRWEWMAAKAIIDGGVTVVGEGVPARYIDFKRDAGHTITLSGSATWDSAGVSIVDNIESWRTMARRAQFGGPINRVTVGADVWSVMRKNDELLDLLDVNRRGTDANFKTGIRTGDRIEYVGTIGGDLDVYVYEEVYKDPDTNTLTNYMESTDVVLTGPGINGVQCFGAIVDLSAEFQPMAIFPKMWNENDPSVTQIMTQSAPLMVPINPNCTVKATVL